MIDPEQPGEATPPQQETPAIEVSPRVHEEEWLTHGGYLGCLLAITFGCLLAAFVASPLVRGAGHAQPGTGFALNFSALIVMLVGIIVCGIIGWNVGKRIYREYPVRMIRRQRQQDAATQREE